MSAPLPLVDVVGVGLNATDTLILLPHFPSFDSKVEFADSRIVLGGQVATAMIACQTWGLRTRYIGSVGDDDASGLQREAFALAGVEAHLVSVPGCLSQLAFILVDGNTGERTILWRRDPRLTLAPEHLQRDWIARARLLHVDGHDVPAAACAARWAREAGVPVTADVDNVYPGQEDLLRNVDYLLASYSLPERVTGKSDLLRALPILAREYGCRVAGVTLGRGGVLAWDGLRFHYCPAFAVETVDTTGAGDVFHGAFAYGLLALRPAAAGSGPAAGWPLQRILEFSCAAAALNCAAVGARGGIRPVEEIERLIREGRRQPAVYDERALERG